MASTVEICNVALAALEYEPILSLEDDNPGAEKCKIFLPPARRFVLTDHPWTFARVRVQLDRLSSAPAFGYSYEYQLPTECLRVFRIEPEYFPPPPYRIEGRKVLTDQTPLKLIYIQDVHDYTQWSQPAADALSMYLAYRIAMPLTKSEGAAQRNLQAYQAARQIAKSLNAQGQRGHIVHDLSVDVIGVRGGTYPSANERFRHA